MYSTKNTKEKIFISKNDVFNKITEEEIFNHYLGFAAEIKKMYHSPFRKDPIPSFNLYYNQRGDLRYKDYGGSQGSCIDFVMNLYNITYEEAIRVIYEDLKLNRVPSNTPLTRRIKPKGSKITCKRRIKEETYDKEYWESFGISKKTLKHYNVINVEFVWLNDVLLWGNDPINPIYAYFFPKTNRVKVYRPLADKKFKWLCNTKNDDIQGYDQLPLEGELLIISKAMKDVMLFHELGFNAIAPQGEGMFIPEDIVIELKTRFKRIITVYDNDEPGVTASIKLNEIIGSGYWNIPKIYKEKDITDFYKVHGKEKTIELLKPLYNVNARCE